MIQNGILIQNMTELVALLRWMSFLSFQETTPQLQNHKHKTFEVADKIVSCPGNEPMKTASPSWGWANEFPGAVRFYNDVGFW